MKRDTSYSVILQVRSEDGEFSQLTVSVTAGDADNARTSAIVKAEKEGHKVTNCHRVDIAG
jgi:hypothetical protein